MPLQNRVDPYGEISANASRGMWMGNRGGCMHTEDKTLTNRRWATRAWIYCVLEFNNRHRTIMTPRRYTELFFLDEVTALSAGHRPCFECQRKRAEEFLTTYAATQGKDTRPYVDDFDRLAHATRLDGRLKRTGKKPIDQLPDGAAIVYNGEAMAVRAEHLLRWSFSGYTTRLPRPSSGVVEVLTPEPFIDILTAGFTPAFHPSADKLSA